MLGNVIDDHSIRMLKPRSDPPLPPRTLMRNPHLRTTHPVIRPQLFDSDIPPKNLITRAPDNTHGAATDLRDEPIAIGDERGGGLERFGGGLDVFRLEYVRFIRFRPAYSAFTRRRLGFYSRRPNPGRHDLAGLSLIRLIRRNPVSFSRYDLIGFRFIRFGLAQRTFIRLGSIGLGCFYFFYFFRLSLGRVSLHHRLHR